MNQVFTQQCTLGISEMRKTSVLKFYINERNNIQPTTSMSSFFEVLSSAKFKGLKCPNCGMKVKS